MISIVGWILIRIVKNFIAKVKPRLMVGTPQLNGMGAMDSCGVSSQPQHWLIIITRD
jgi:hypothetical protein